MQGHPGLLYYHAKSSTIDLGEGSVANCMDQITVKATTKPALAQDSQPPVTCAKC